MKGASHKGQHHLTVQAVGLISNRTWSEVVSVTGGEWGVVDGAKVESFGDGDQHRSRATVNILLK